MPAVSIPLGSDVAFAEDESGLYEHTVDNTTMKKRKRIRSLINAPFDGKKP